MGLPDQVTVRAPRTWRLPRPAAVALRLVALLAATSAVTFALVAASPVDPVKANLGQAAYAQMSDAQRAELAEYWGADTPLPQRYAHWLKGALRGDLGQSLRFGRPVTEVVGERSANSLALMASAWLLAGVLGLALGVAAGARRGGPLDRAVTGICLVLSSMPSFWLGLVALMVFSVGLGWFPLGFSVPIGVDATQVSWASRLHHLVLPALVLGVANAPSIALHTREKTIEVMQGDYARFALSRGETRRQVLLRHGLRNLVLPALLPQLLVGMVLAFPHAILHEASVTFLGFGLSADEPAVGVILSEAMRYLSTGSWWLAVLPGAALVAVVLVFDRLGSLLRDLASARAVQE